VSGLTVQQTEEKLDKAMSTYIRQPQVVVNVVEIRSQPVSVLGAVNTPGVHQVQGNKTLLEMLALAGGMRQDAGYSIRITREQEWGCIPLPKAQLDPSGKFSVAEVNVRKNHGRQESRGEHTDSPSRCHFRSEGRNGVRDRDVKHSGGFVLGEHQSISILQLFRLPRDLNSTADTRHARILRLQHDADQRQELAVDVKGVLAGKKSDVTLQGDDILFIPGSTGKKAAMRTLEAAIQTGTGLAIWRMP